MFRLDVFSDAVVKAFLEDMDTCGWRVLSFHRPSAFRAFGQLVVFNVKVDFKPCPTLASKGVEWHLNLQAVKFFTAVYALKVS